jgi:hypothetical protein
VSGQTLTASCDAFRLTVRCPAPDAPRLVHGTVDFVRTGGTKNVTVSLALFAHFKKRFGHTGIAGEATIAGCTTTVARADDGASFTVELPSVARTYDGDHLRIEPGVLAAGDDGNALRVLLPEAFQDRSPSVLRLRDRDGLAHRRFEGRPQFRIGTDHAERLARETRQSRQRVQEHELLPQCAADVLRMLRVDARGYLTFPSGIRQAIPISLDTALATDEEFAVDSALTRVGLIELPAGSGTASISGTVEVPDTQTRLPD